MTPAAESYKRKRQYTTPHAWPRGLEEEVTLIGALVACIIVSLLMGFLGIHEGFSDFVVVIDLLFSTKTNKVFVRLKKTYTLGELL